jgi:hypothetical protein
MPNLNFAEAFTALISYPVIVFSPVAPSYSEKIMMGGGLKRVQKYRDELGDGLVALKTTRNENLPRNRNLLFFRAG